MRGLDRDLDEVVLGAEDAALVVAVAGGARPAHDLVAGLCELEREAVHLGLGAHGKGHVRPARPRGALLAVAHVRPGHDLQARPVVKGQEVGAKVRDRVEVALARDGSEEALEELARSLEVADVQRDVLDSHVIPFPVGLGN